MDYLAFRLSQVMDRPVVNQTKLAGTSTSTWHTLANLPPVCLRMR